MWEGFGKMDVLAAPLAGSPKFHDHVLMAPAFETEISWKRMILLTQPAPLILKLLVGNGFTTTEAVLLCN